MNKIFKVIWSKSKQCYVVVSEITKNTTGKKKIIVASILAGLAMSTMGPNVMAVSSIPFTDKPSSALGNGSVKSGTTNGVAIGNAAYSDSNQSIAIGFRSLASGTFLGGSIKPSVAVGAGAHAEGNNTVAIGTVAENRASYGVSLGNESKVTSGSDYGIAIGFQTQVSNVHGMAIGEKASASGFIGMALGANAKATGSYSYAGGFDSESGGEAAIAVGKSASAGGGDAVAIGTSSQATGGDSIALGKNANASDGDSIAIGQDTVSDKINSVALGKTSKATGASATALGPQAKATGSTAVAIGLNSEANQSATVAVGYNSAASGENAAAYGNTAKAVGKNSLALGANTQATVEGGVALGAGSIANTVAGAGYNPNTGRTNIYTPILSNALTSTWAAVSIGDGTNTRQLTGLAAGSKDTDAVNVAQLKSMNLAFTADGSTKGDVNLTNSALNVVGDSTYITTKGDNQTLTISGKKQNITVTNGTASASAGMADANNVAQAINQANADQTISYKANGGTANTVKVSDGLNFTNGTTTVATIGANGQVTYDLNTTTKQSITDSSTAVNRTIALGSDSGSTTAKKLSTSAIAFNIKGDTGANALITTTATGDNVSITPTAKLTAAVAAAENAANKNLSNISSSGETVIKNLAKGAAQDAVKVAGTGLATVSDNTVGGVKTYTVDVNTGNLVVAANGQVGAAGTTGASGAAGSNGVATTQNVATAINDAIAKSNANNAQALGDAKHNFAGDDATVISRKHGEQLNIKGGASTTATDLTSGNIAVVGDTASGTLNIKMAKALTGLTSATFTDGSGNTQTVTGGSSTITDGAGNTTTITKGGVTTTDAAGNTTTTAPTGVTVTPAGAGATPISVTTSGISAGNKEIKNVANGTTDDAAVNKKQMDDALKGATDNTVSLGSESGSTTAKKLSTTGGIKFNIKGETGANALITTSATGDDVTIAPTAKLSAAVTAAEKSADKDLSNLSAAGDTYIKNLAKTAASWNVETNGAGTTAVSGGESVNFINGDNIAITNAGRAITIGTAKNVSFDKVTVGGVVLDKTDGINAGGKEVKGIADGTAADSAVSKGQMETAIANAQTAATSTEKVIAKALTGDTNLATVTGQTGTAKGETYEVAVSENAVKNVAKAAAQDAVTITGTGLATVSDNTTGGVKTYTVNVDEGKLVLDDTTGKIGANGATQGTTVGKNGVATTQNVATAINDAVAKAKASTTQALADAEHKFDGDTGATSVRKHGEVLSIKGGVTTPADLSTGNIGVVSDGAGTLNIRLAKVLSGLTSATFTDGSGNTQTVTGASSTITDGAGNTTAMTKGGLSTTDGTNTMTVAPAGVTATDGTNTVKLNGSGIDAGNTQIKNVGKATTDDAAVNKKQMDDAVKAATDATTALGNNTIALGSDAGSTTAKKLSTSAITFNIKGDTGANALITTSATGDDVTIAPTAKLTAAVTAAEKSADKDLSNISSAGKTVIKDLAATSAQDAVNVTGTGLATVSDNIAGGVKTYTVNVDEGKLVLDDTTGKIGANGATQGTTAGKNGVATTQNVATAINDAITKANANTAQALADAEHKFDGDTGATSVRKHGEVLSIKGGVTNAADLATGNIGVVSDGAGTLNIRLAKILSGLTSATFKDASGNTTMVTGGSTTIADTSGNTQTLAPTKSEIKDNNGVSTVTTKDGVTAKDASGQTTSLTKGGVNATDGNGNTTSLTNTGVSATDGNGHTTGLTNGGLSTTDGTNTTTVAPTGMTATDGTNTVKVGGSGIDAGGTEIKHIAAGTAADSAVNKGQMDDAITKATADAAHKFDGDTGATSVRKHGEVLSIKGGVTDTNKLSDNNIGVISDGAGTLNVKLSKDLTGLTSATFKDGSGNTQTVTGASSTITDGTGNTTAMTKGGLSTTDGTNTTTVAPTGVTATDGTNIVKLNGSGIDAGNTQIKNVGKATTDDAAVNKKQMDEAVKAASDATKALGNNTITLGGDSVSTTTAKALNTTGGIQFNIKGQTGTDALITTSASGDDVTITPTDKLTNAVKAAEKSADKDLSNLSAAGNTHIQDLAKSAASWNVQTNGNGTTAVVGGDTVNFINGDNIAITNTGHAITIGTAKNVSFDKVTVGGMTLDKNGLLSGITSITGAGSGAPTMTFNSQNGNTPANVSINSNLDMGGHRITGVGPAEKPTDAVNKQQVDQALRGLTGMADNAARQYASKAGANAAALAALKPIQYDPLEPTQIMAGVGNYKSQTAVALGMAHYTNENTMFNIGVSLDSHDNMVNAGVTHKFGYSPEKKAIPDRYKGGPISSIYVMQDEMQALLAKDQEKDAVISKQASEIDTLRQQNEDMQRKIDMILAKLQ